MKIMLEKPKEHIISKQVHSNTTTRGSRPEDKIFLNRENTQPTYKNYNYEREFLSLL